MSKFFVKNRLKLGLSVIIVFYVTFLTCFCIAKTREQNDTTVKLRDPSMVKNTMLSKDEGMIEQNQNSITTIGPVYLNEITDFYELVITILFGIIGVLLAGSFIYVHSTSKMQAQKLAIEALESKPFEIRIQSILEASANEFIEEYSQIPDLKSRIEWIEEKVNERGYEFSDENSSET
jgi:hypothetical protein